MISFGLVNIPVKLYTAVNRKNVRFNQIDARTGSRIRQKKVSALDGTEVPNEELVKGYEIAKDQYVIVEDGELAALDPAAQRTIDIEEFVDLADIDPMFYDAAYYVAPAGQLAKPYQLLVQAMEDMGKVGIAHFVMRTKQYVAALRPVDGHLVLSTMVYADEIVDPAQIPELSELGPVDEADIAPKELAMAEQLIETLAGTYDAEKYHDTHREQVLALIQQKAAGELVVASAEPEAGETTVIDLIAALEASIAERGAARERHPTSQTPAVSVDDEADERSA